MSQYFAVNVMTPDLALTFLKLRDDSRGPGHLVLTPCGTVMQRVFPATVNGWETWLLSSKLQVLPIGTYIRAQGPSLSHLDPHLSVKVTDYRVGGYCHFTTVCTLTSSGHEFNVLCPSLSLSSLSLTYLVHTLLDLWVWMGGSCSVPHLQYKTRGHDTSDNSYRQCMISNAIISVAGGVRFLEILGNSRWCIKTPD